MNDEATILQSATRWGQSIHATSLDTAQKNRLENILSQLLVQKLTSLSYKEIEQMLQLTPLDETWAGRELIAKGKAEMLGSLLQAKFGISESELPPALFRMTSNELDGLSKVIFSAESYQQAERLILAIVGSRVSN